jgi:crossover junction endodeoxyribonuclease RuvC
MIHVGIDPGNSGALVILSATNALFFDTPTVKVKVGKKVKNQINPHACASLLREFIGVKDVLVTIEKVSPMPSFKGPDGPQSMGVTSAFSFGWGYGIWIGICAAMEIPYQLVHPASWKRRLMSDMAKGKDASRVKAMQLYPWAAKDLTRVKDHGRADALLLAHYGLMYGAPKVEQEEETESTLF